MYVSNWFGNTVQRFDIADPFHPVLKATVSVPHPNMLRLSRDNERLYVTNFAHAVGQRSRLRPRAEQRLRDLAVRGEQALPAA